MTSIKGQIEAALTEKLFDTREGILNPDRRKNNGPQLFEIFYWQEIEALAKKRVENAWGAAEADEVVKTDGHYRDLGAGETIAAESERFSVLMKVSAPRKTIDKELFLKRVALHASMRAEALEALWGASLKESKPSLSKRVLEV